ncbi:ATP-binding protein [Geoalkalibacter halelectricus]|uniref:ATP-binding protein n=1 Tax=Geoalkalibacter halelectricus TaxID=2847045 RepID=A0ABY5ZRD6_9BACT|nr:ATP-binding protein [Geoalkalibacter halelectricus]UWZ79791.1 ATP-binding protein [Geoalkalibacter halelectricus]
MAEYNPAAIRDLATGLFIERREHVLLYGPAGTGKTHLAQALGHHACRSGRSVLFLKAVKLFRTLQSSRADNSWDAELRRLLAPDLLIIDDFGLKPMTMTQAAAPRSLSGSSRGSRRQKGRRENPCGRQDSCQPRRHPLRPGRQAHRGPD